MVSFGLLISISACSDDVTDANDVNWNRYDPEVKIRIDSMTKNEDCVGLQKEFDTAFENDNMQRARVGTGNSQLMNYLDVNMKKIGCY